VRLKSNEVAVIKRVITQFDSDAAIYLYGSRVDDDKKGGDIDILVLSKNISFLDKLKIKVTLYAELGEQKIDLLIAENASKPFVKMVFEEAMPL